MNEKKLLLFSQSLKKIHLFALCFAAIGFLALCIFSAGVSAETLYTTDGVNVRKKPNSSSKVRATLSAKTAVNKTGESGNWIAVSVDGIKGYIYKDYLSSNSETVADGSTSSDNSGSNTTYVNSSDVNLRKKANSHCKIKGVLTEGESVTVLSHDGNWTRVRTQAGTTGYVYSIYLGKKSETVHTQPTLSRADVISQYRSDAIAYAKTRLNDIYSQAMRDTEGYADCSSLVRDAFQNASGKCIGDTTVNQSDTMEDYMYSIDKITDVTPGDLIYHLSGDNHTGIYLGNGQVLHASQSSGYVKISSYDSSGDYWEYGCNAAAYCYDN